MIRRHQFLFVCLALFVTGWAVADTQQESAASVEAHVEESVASGQGLAQAVAADSAGTRATVQGDATGARFAAPSVSVQDNSGGAALRYPIAVPPGRKGQAPAVILSYSSLNRANGILGLGWSLSLGYIERSGRRGGVPKYNDTATTTDEFSLHLGGATSRLIKISSQSDDQVWEYRTEMESFQRIRFFKDANYWVVTDKQGTHSIFGFGFTADRRDAQSYQTDPEVDRAKVWRWRLDRVLDTNGNYLTLEYRAQPADYPVRIRYHGHVADIERFQISNPAHIQRLDPQAISSPREILFVYDDEVTPTLPRSDRAVSYRSGFRIEMANRIKQILVRVDGQLVRRYELSYAQSEEPGHASLLERIQEFSAASTTLPPTIFQYSRNDSPGWRSPQVLRLPVNPGEPDAYFGYSYYFPDPRFFAFQHLTVGMRALDLNGDGCTDIVQAWEADGNPPIRRAWLSDCLQGFRRDDRYAPPAASSLGGLLFEKVLSRPLFVVDNSIRFAELDGDGKPDMVRSFNNGGNRPVNGCPAGRTCAQAWLSKTPERDTPSGSAWEEQAERDGRRPYAPPRHFTNYGLNPERMDDEGVLLLDLNGDGITDMIHKVHFHSSRYSGCGDGGQSCGAWLGTGDPDNPWVWAPEYIPPQPLVYRAQGFTYIDLGLRAIDVNGDGLPDLVQALIFNLDDGHGSLKPYPRSTTPIRNVWINTGHGWRLDNSYLQGLTAVFTEARGELDPDDFPRNVSHGYAFLDVNGDGLTDMVYGRDLEGGRQFAHGAFLNTGRGWVHQNESGSYAAPAALVRYLAGHNVEPRGLVELDVNGDGLPDLLQLFRREGAGAGTYFRLWLNNSKVPDLLIKVTTPLGGATEITYIPSTKDPTRPDGPNPNPEVPNVFQVVRSIKNDPGIGAVSETRYEFSDGRYFGNRERQELRGFRVVKATDATTGDQTITTYLQGDCSKGLVGARAVANARNELFSAALFQYRLDNCADEPPPYRNYLVRRDHFACDGRVSLPAEGEDFPTSCRHTAVEFDYDNYGNPREERQLGDVTQPGSERTVQRTFSSNEAAWMVGLPLEERHLGYDADGAWRVLTEHRFSYDNPNAENPTCLTTDCLDAPGDYTRPVTKGNLTGVHQGGAGEVWRTINHKYDRYGNVIRSIDPLRSVTTHAYDATGIFLTEIINALNHRTTLEYDPRFGVVRSVTDPNGHSVVYQYDEFGRKTAETTCADRAYPGARPSLRVHYNVSQSPGLNFTRIERLESYLSSAEATPVYRWSKAIVDGFGRTIQTQQESETPGEVIAMTTYYDSQGRVYEATLPYTITAGPMTGYLPAPRIRSAAMRYDVSNRVVEARNPDDTVNRTEYDRGAITHTDENGKQKTLRYDVYGQLVEVEERNREQGSWQSYTTRYAYDGLGRRVAAQDHLGNRMTFSYDSLSQRRSVTDPDLGTWAYDYDAAGRLKSQSDARGYTSCVEYDALDRIVRKRSIGAGSNCAAAVSAAPDVVYTYDERAEDGGAYVFRGLLVKVEDRAGVRRFNYDCLGRATRTEYNLCSGAQPTTYAFVTDKYDPGDRLLEKTYPDGDVIAYDYNSRGLLQAMRIAGPVPKSIINNIRYHETGKPLLLEFGNGVQTAYAYHDGNLRLKEVTTTREGARLQYVQYAYDGVGNVTATLDGSDMVQTFVYDDLYRLIAADAPAVQGPQGYGAQRYEYDAIGNLRRHAGRQYWYDDPDPAHPHAVKKVFDGARETVYSYDANGHMRQVAVNGAALRKFSYDYDNRLSVVRGGDDELVTKFVYDGAGARVKKLAYRNGDPNDYDLTIYLGDYLIEHRGDTGQERRVKYLGGYAKHERRSDETTVYYFHKDLLGSTSVITDEAGRVVEKTFYKPYGALQQSDPSLGERFKFTGQELDPETDLYYYGARYYDPVLGRFIAADSSDSIIDTNPQTLNRYAYVLNNPMTLLDPTGKQATESPFITLTLPGLTPDGLANLTADVLQLPARSLSAGDFNVHCAQCDCCTPESMPTFTVKVDERITPTGDQLFVAYIGAGALTALEWSDPLKLGEKFELGRGGILETNQASIDDELLNTALYAKSMNQPGGFEKAELTSPHGILFAQDKASPNFGKPGEIGGARNVWELAEGLRSGRIKPDQIEPINVIEKDGFLWTLDHRRLRAFQLADMDVPIKRLSLSDPIVRAEFYKKWDTTTGGLILKLVPRALRRLK